MRLTQGSPPAVLSKIGLEDTNRLDEEIPKREGAKGGRSTGSTEDSGPTKPGNSVEDKTLTIRKRESDSPKPGYRNGVIEIGEVVDERWQ